MMPFDKIWMCVLNVRVLVRSGEAEWLSPNVRTANFAKRHDNNHYEKDAKLLRRIWLV